MEQLQKYSRCSVYFDQFCCLLPHPPRVSLAHARSPFRPALPSACYAFIRRLILLMPIVPFLVFGRKKKEELEKKEEFKFHVTLLLDEE